MGKNPQDILTHLRNTFENGTTRPLEYRIKQLKAFKRMLEENKTQIIEALYKDLHKCRYEAIITEIDFVINDVTYALSHVREWDKPQKPKKEFANILDSVYILNDPYGVVLVLGSWNYPLQLPLAPVIGAIAAGNCVIVKPSELAPATSKFIADYFPKYLDQDAYYVYEGGIPETTELLKYKFDYIFYTGSTAVGKIIHTAANKYMTPTTLELGGKSPVYLDASANIETATNRIIWGKCLNAGQTCVAPDYLICSKEVQDKFVACAKRVLLKFYGEDPKSSPDFGRIVNERHFQRLTNLLKNSVIAIGGQHDISEKYIAPTVVINASPSDPIMQEEIFGPILPIVNAETVQDAINFINKGEKPLSMYIFSSRKKDIKLMLAKTSAGGVSVNDTIMHLAVPTLPFGGVGSSGMGQYHGQYSYDTFVHKKSVLHKDLGALGEALSAPRYPPYSSGKLRYLQFMLAPGINLNFKCLSHLITFGLGIMAVFVAKYLQQNLKK